MHSKKSFRVNTSSSRAATPAKKFSTNEELAARADLPPTQIAEFREIFRLIDTDGSDTLSLAELKNLLENLHFDTMQLEDEFYMDLLGKVKKNKQRAPLVAATPGGRKNAAAEKAYFHEVTFDELMAVLLKRPPVVGYTKGEMSKHFAALAGAHAKPGKISFDVLKSAIRNGDGGIDPSMAEDMMIMMTNVHEGEVDYHEMIELFMGKSAL